MSNAFERVLTGALESGAKSFSRVGGAVLGQTLFGSGSSNQAAGANIQISSPDASKVTSILQDKDLDDFSKAGLSQSGFVKGISDSALRSAKIPNIPEPTEQGILELETILKNLKTGGKPSRSLNADGGYVGLKDGGDVSLTVIEIPDISGSGVETLFKKR